MVECENLSPQQPPQTVFFLWNPMVSCDVEGHDLRTPYLARHPRLESGRMAESEERLPQQPPQAHTDHGFRTMSTSVPSSDYSLHTSGVSPAISKCSQLLPQPIAIIDINRPPICNSEHYGDAIHATNADTSSNWQSGAGTIVVCMSWINFPPIHAACLEKLSS
ncbi:hypothetical protein Tco_0144211 [Tanacetum coccineum]